MKALPGSLARRHKTMLKGRSAKPEAPSPPGRAWGEQRRHLALRPIVSGPSDETHLQPWTERSRNYEASGEPGSLGKRMESSRHSKVIPTRSLLNLERHRHRVGL